MPGSVKRDAATQTIEFLVTDGVQTYPVSYRGLAPDTFTDAQDIEVVVEGRLGRDGVFHPRTTLLAKCGSRYEEKYKEGGTPRPSLDRPSSGVRQKGRPREVALMRLVPGRKGDRAGSLFTAIWGGTSRPVAEPSSRRGSPVHDTPRRSADSSAAAASASNPGPWGLNRRVWAEWQARQSFSL